MEIEAGEPPRAGALMLFPGALGDAVCVEPAVRWLSRDRPVTFSARGAAAEVARLFPCRPTVHSLDAPEVARLFAPADTREPRGDEWLEQFAVIVSFTGASNPDFRARLRATGRARLIPFPERTGTKHAGDEMLFGVVGSSETPAAWPLLEAPRDGSDLLEGLPRPLLALHPGGGGAAKRAPEGLLFHLMRSWREHSGGGVVVLLGPAEAGGNARWEGRADRVLCPETVAALAGALAAADAYVGNDSGPSHMAAALGLPVTVLFTATEPARFGPRGPGCVYVNLPDACEESSFARIWAAVGAALP